MRRRARIKLITIPWELEVPTLSLASLAAVTPSAFDIAIVDLTRERLVIDEEVELVGLSASTARIKAAYALGDLYRSRGVKVVIGGHHATALPEEALEHADAVVCGEGETSWMRICDEYLTNPSRVGGIYRDPAPDPAELPQPRIDLMKIERYGRFYYPVIASRGCPESCSFCFAKRMTKGYRTYPIAHVIEQVRRRPAFVQGMYFVDDNLPGDVDYARELFKELSRYRVPFGMQARHEFAMNRDDLRLAREAGCALISSGYETVNQTTLDKTGKRANAAAYREVIKAIFDEGMIPSGNWMFGFDWDTPDIFRQTLEFLDSTEMVHCAFTCEIPFPGTPAFQRYRQEGRLLSSDYDDYIGKDHIVVHPKQMTPTELREGIRWLALQFYSLRRTTRRSIRGLRNPRLLKHGPAAVRAPALLALNYFQVWQWNYRMVPSLQWLYQRLVSANKYRYLQDLWRRSNFGTSELVHSPDAASAAVFETKSPFLHRGGHKPRREAALQPIA